MREKETIHDAGSYFPFLREGLNLSVESSAHRLLSVTRWDRTEEPMYEEHHEQKWQMVALFQHSFSSECVVVYSHRLRFLPYRKTDKAHFQIACCRTSSCVAHPDCSCYTVNRE